MCFPRLKSSPRVYLMPEQLVSNLLQHVCVESRPCFSIRAGVHQIKNKKSFRPVFAERKFGRIVDPIEYAPEVRGYFFLHRLGNIARFMRLYLYPSSVSPCISLLSIFPPPSLRSLLPFSIPFSFKPYSHSYSNYFSFFPPVKHNLIHTSSSSSQVDKRERR